MLRPPALMVESHASRARSLTNRLNNSRRKHQWGPFRSSSPAFIKYRSTDGDEWAIKGTHPFVASFKRNPVSLEPELNSGQWVVLHFDPRSIKARWAIDIGSEAVRILRDQGISIRLGVRPYDMNHHDLHSLYGLQNDEALYVAQWVLLQDGAPVGRLVGVVFIDGPLFDDFSTPVSAEMLYHNSAALASRLLPHFHKSDR